MTNENEKLVRELEVSVRNGKEIQMTNEDKLQCVTFVFIGIIGVLLLVIAAKG